MSAVEEAIKNRVHLDARRRRMAEMVVATIGALGPEPSPERTQWLSYGDSLLAAIDAQESAEINLLLEEGYRHALFSGSERSRRSAPPREGEALNGVMVFQSSADVKHSVP